MHAMEGTEDEGGGGGEGEGEGMDGIDEQQLDAACDELALLAEVEQKVKAQEQSPWLITPQEAAVLLMYQQSIDWSTVNRRPTANKLLGGVRNTFFVEAGSAALGKRK